MRSIFSKVLIWSLGTFALSMVAYWAIARAFDRRGLPEGDPFRRMIELVEDAACRAYEEGGPTGCRRTCGRLDAELPGEHLLTDARGRDLVTGDDRSELLRTGKHKAEPPRMPDGRIDLRRPAAGRPLRFIYDRPPLVRAAEHPALLRGGRPGHRRHGLRSWPSIWPDRSGTCGGVVDQFGRGDLAARVGSTRRTRSASCRGPSTRWPVGSRRCWRPNVGCCRTSRTSCARP